MKTCPYCGREAEDTALTCGECGTVFDATGDASFRVPPFLRTLAAVIFLSLALRIGCFATSVLIHELFPWFLALAATSWATTDASIIRQRHLSDGLSWPVGDTAIRLQCCKPIIIFGQCLFCWPLGFAWYLLMRRRLVQSAPKA